MSWTLAIKAIDGAGIGDPVGYVTAGVVVGAVASAALAALFVTVGIDPLLAAVLPPVVVAAVVLGTQPES